MAPITTTRGDVDEAALRKTEYVSADTDDHRVVWTEYCEAACTGPAHTTGQPDTAMVFCAQHIHHSVHVTMKRWPEGAMLGGVGEFK